MCISFLLPGEKNALRCIKNGETPKRLSVFRYFFSKSKGRCLSLYVSGPDLAVPEDGFFPPFHVKPLLFPVPIQMPAVPSASLASAGYTKCPGE